MSRTYRWLRKPHNQFRDSWWSNNTWWRKHFWKEVGGHSIDNCKAARTEQHRNLRHQNKTRIHKGRDVEKHCKI